VWRLPLAGGKPGKPERLIFSTRRDIEPRYSPDGHKIAFTSDRSGANEVWVCDADGSDALQLTSMNATMTAGARWSPDGQRLVFVSSLEGQQELYLTGANGGQPVRLTNNPAHDSAPSWSRDGKRVYFVSNRSGRFEIWRMPPDPTASPTQVTVNGGFAAIESTDGKTLYYAKGSRIWQTPTGGGTEAEVIRRLSEWGNFDVTDSGIYYISSGGLAAEIRFWSFATRRNTRMAMIEKRPAFGLAAALDNSAVLYSQFDAESTELVLIENFR
jgi:Tol biopolymer transport system component